MYLGDMDVKVGKKAVFKSNSSHSLHVITNDNGLRLMDLATGKGLVDYDIPP